MIILVLGVKGVGKSTLINQLTPSIKNSEIVNFGTAMVEHAKKLGIKDREELSSLSVSNQRMLQAETAKNIHELSEKGKIVFVDTHAHYLSQKGRVILPGLPEVLLSNLRPSLILLLVTEPGIIYERRTNDEKKGKRHRNPESIPEIKNIQKLEIITATDISTDFGIPIKILDRTGGLKELKYQVKEVLDAIDLLKN